MARSAKTIKAEDVVILDVSKIAGFCDYFVIASGNSLRQTDAIAQAIRDGLEKLGIKSLSKVARGDESGWVALDYVSVIAHVFYKPMREFYSLESLWSDAKKVRVVSAKRK
ncbi:MAG: ribosome silencing factor [Candidatus Omnitrophica bacterium]|nr:ribosome silencing factor [Candidatus Omnitrophota bacterium]MDD5771631.1 ribosome silencing factor [Candidatus Omnitrophota bacterium]